MYSWTIGDILCVFHMNGFSNLNDFYTLDSV